MLISGAPVAPPCYASDLPIADDVAVDAAKVPSNRACLTRQPMEIAYPLNYEL